MPFSILWPTFALVALIFAVWWTMFLQRGLHMRRHPPTTDITVTHEAALDYFAPVQWSANNLRNLFEMPVLYFALVPLLLITRQAGHVEVLLAWAFVILRILHSVVHIAIRSVPLRTAAYAFSCFVLMAMWIVFALHIIDAASAYDAAMDNLQGVSR